MKRLRIAMISDHASPLAVGALGGADGGGQNVYVAQTAKNLAALGCEVDVFTRRADETQPEIVRFSENVRVVHVPAGAARFVRKEDLFDLMPEFTDFLLRFCRRNHYDIVHANFFLSGMAALELKKTLNLPFVVTFHALGKVRRAFQNGADEFPDARFEIEEAICRAADRIVAECPQDKADLLRFYNADREKIRIIGCGFDDAEMYPVEKSHARSFLGLPPDENVILQLGRVVPRKGIETVVRATAELVKNRRLNAKLLIVGGETREPDAEKTPEIGRLRRIADELGIAENVIFTGSRNRDELKYFYSAADVFATVPWYEPFGITPLEAMACRAAVVGSRVGGIKFTVADGANGFLVEPKNEFALADKLEILLTDKDLRRRFGEKGLARVRRHFTWQQIAKQINEVYREVLEAGKRRAETLFPASLKNSYSRIGADLHN